MEFVSILDPEESSFKNQMRPAYFQDLNLEQIIEKIQFQWGKNVTSYFYYFPENEKCERYRREVYKDVKTESVYEMLMDYVNQMRDREKALRNKIDVEEPDQKPIWHLWEVYHYCHAFEQLYQQLCEWNPTSEGFRKFKEYLANYLEDEAFQAMRDQCFALLGQLREFRLVLKLEDDKISVMREEVEGNYEQFLEECFPGKKREFRSPFAANLNMSYLEQELFLIYSKNKKHAPMFREIESFYKTYEQYEDATLVRFGEEIGFYLSFYGFEKNMKQKGFAFTVPDVDAGRDMQAAGLYDLALACVNSGQNKEVVSNDMVYYEGEEFFVVTGPNQGGKTTFARSLGQLVYFAKMGLDVPAISANVPYFTNVLTHFSVEESIETGRGKLKEELERLEPMMHAYYENAFVIINELFTTAANYDACIMGKRVLQHFLNLKCRGVYVTHLKELSEADERIVSLKALVKQVENKNIRSFKVIRQPADDLGYSGDLVEKYRLNYEQLMKRMQS